MKKRAWLAAAVLAVMFYAQPIFAETGSPGTCEYWQGKWEFTYSSGTDNVTITDVCSNPGAGQVGNTPPACMGNSVSTCEAKGRRASDNQTIMIGQAFIDMRIYAYYEAWTPGSTTPYDAVHYRDFVDVAAYLADPFHYTGGYTAMIPGTINSCDFAAAADGSFTAYSQLQPAGFPYANTFGLVSGARLMPECINSTTTTTTIGSTTTTVPLTSQACADWLGTWNFTYNTSHDSNPGDAYSNDNGTYEITINDVQGDYNAGPLHLLCYAAGTRKTDGQHITIMQPDNATLITYAQVFPGAAKGAYLYYEASGSAILSTPFAQILSVYYTGEDFSDVGGNTYGLVSGSKSVITTSSTTTTIAGTTTTPATTTIGGTTTTTIVPGASTTTTTVNGTKCPISKALGDNNPNVERLRAFRDNRLATSAVGRKIIQIYYNNADSINAALERSPALRAVTRRGLEAIAPMAGRKE